MADKNKKFRDKITIRFEAEGDKALTKAISALNKQTRLLLNTQNKIRSSLGGYNKAQDKTNKLGLLGVRNFRNLKKSVSGTSVAFSVLRSKLLLAAFAYQVINRTIGTLVRAVEQQQLAEKKLETAIRSTGNATGISAGMMKVYASRLQSVTRFGDEAIISAQALLLTFTKIGRETFPDAIEASLNMSEAMGQDLQQTIVQVGKALNDPIKGVTALRRVGVQLTDQQETQINQFVQMNDLASAQKIILGELEVQFGGMARASLNTIGGAFQQLNNAWSDLLQRLGQRIIPALQSVSEILSDITLNFMGEKEQEIKILERLGYSEDFIKEKRIAALKFSLEASALTNKSLKGELETKQQVLHSLHEVELSYGALNQMIKQNSTVLESNDATVVSLMKKYDLTRKEMEFLIRTGEVFKSEGAEQGTTWEEFLHTALNLVPALKNWKSWMDLANDAQFLNVVATRSQHDEYLELAQALKLDIEQLRTLAELLGHNFPGVLVTASLSLEEFKNALAMVSSTYDNLLSSVESYNKTISDSRKQQELDSAALIKDEEQRNVKIEAINIKYEKLASERARKMKIWKMASAISNTALAMTQVYADETIKPSWLKIPLAAMIAASGLLQVGTIQAQAFAKGGDFITDKPELIMVGEAGRERVKITPIDRPEDRALSGDNIINVNIHGGIIQDDYVANTLIPEINNAIASGVRLEA